MVKEVLDWMVLGPFWLPADRFWGAGLFQNMFHNLLMYTDNFCFGHIAVSCFFETSCVVGKFDLNENPVVSLDLDFDLGFVNMYKLEADIL